MKKRALFIPASIRSHVLPSFFLADILSEDFDITYAVTTKILEESVLENGFQSIIISGNKAGVGLEARFIQEQGERVTFFRLMKSYLSHEIYWKRKKELDELVEKLEPDVIIMDVFSSTDFLVLHHHRHLKLMFFNPMPSTYRIEDYPIVSEGVWLKNLDSTEKKEKNNWLDFIKSPKNAVMNWVVKNQMKNLMKISQVSENQNLVENKFTISFNNVPELLLLPLEFEFSPKVKKEYQYYLGLCQREARKDTELDEKFEAQWQNILAQKQQGYRIIYCSFGTFYEGSDKVLLQFVERLINVVEKLNEILLIISVNSLVSQTILSKMKCSSTFFFTKVPQLEVLKFSDLFITHGGMGSIKESIEYEVPMIVYPLDPLYDQNGNALKVEYHKIGLRGKFYKETDFELENKIKEVLENDFFKKSIKAFSRNVKTKYPDKKLLTDFHNLLETY